MARKRPPIRFHFDDPIYECRIFVSIGEPVDQWERRLDKILCSDKTIASTLYGRAFLPTETKDCAVWFRETPGGGTAVHEAFHLTCHILTRSGLTLSSSSEEAWAYHLGWVVRQIAKKAW